MIKFRSASSATVESSSSLHSSSLRWTSASLLWTTTRVSSPSGIFAGGISAFASVTSAFATAPARRQLGGHNEREGRKFGDPEGRVVDGGEVLCRDAVRACVRRRGRELVHVRACPVRAHAAGLDDSDPDVPRWVELLLEPLRDRLERCIARARVGQPGLRPISLTCNAPNLVAE
ncbi:hypothetical protein BD413DRAFT_301268 [Trametes elegans]|nr:hypothetical protein BD413DRAFT_301268 [Trametes elegans]